MIRLVGSRFRAQQAMRIATERDAQGRVWCQLFPLGEWHRADFPDGKLQLTAELLNAFIASWKAGGSPPLPVDYNHEEDGPAAGWIEDLRLSPAGELEGAIKWTDAAAAEIRADERRYLSPTWSMRHVNRRTGEEGGPWLYGAALLNDPFYDSMPRVAASATASAGAQPPPTSPTKAREGEDNTMNKKRICAALGLPEDCGDEEVMAAIEAKCKASLNATEQTGKLTAALKSATDDTAKLTARVAELEANNQKHAEEIFTRDFEAVFSAGLAEGRQGLPALKDTLKATAKALGLEEAKKLIAGLSKLPMQATGVAGNNSDANKAKAALEELNALVDTKVKAGMPYRDAYKAAQRERRDLADLLHSTPINPSLSTAN